MFGQSEHDPKERSKRGPARCKLPLADVRPQILGDGAHDQADRSPNRAGPSCQLSLANEEVSEARRYRHGGEATATSGGTDARPQSPVAAHTTDASAATASSRRSLTTTWANSSWASSSRSAVRIRAST